MEALWRWLSDEPKSWRAIAGFIIFIVTISLAWSFIMIFVFQSLGVRLVSHGAQEIGFGTAGWLSWILFFVVLFILAFVEEVIFRFPLFLIAFFIYVRKGSINNLLWSAIILSAIFGYLHGNWINIFIQGVIGVFLSFAFLKGGALASRPGKGLLISTTAHFLYNAAVTILFLVL